MESRRRHLRQVGKSGAVRRYSARQLDVLPGGPSQLARCDRLTILVAVVVGPKMTRRQLALDLREHE
jgi:hypothetical protein